MGNIDCLNRCWREYTDLSVSEGLGWRQQVVIHAEDLPGQLEQ